VFYREKSETFVGCRRDREVRRGDAVLRQRGGSTECRSAIWAWRTPESEFKLCHQLVILFLGALPEVVISPALAKIDGLRTEFGHTGASSVRSRTMKIDADEKELLESVERGEWKPAKGGKRERARLKEV
jgi:hypothetical protein